mmetsp:Transcript_5641/g.19186  ORF Transcript_5641/g.19186 Transcript_5641/m.19186 type:complete len:234 (-) Transcript_5641:224-925(-)
MATGPPAHDARDTAADASAPAADVDRKNDSFCAICWVAGEDQRVDMPCCGSPTSTTWYCRRCIEIVCETSYGGVGMCPMNCGPITIEDGVVKKATRTGRCLSCLQDRLLVNRHVCAACELGTRFTLRYECERCHRVQRIPHPMWRYQTAGVDQFGTVTWACHQACGDFTCWRVLAEDAPHVPQWDAPEAWGQRDGWLEVVRQRRLQEVEVERNALRGGGGEDDEAQGGFCLLM